VGAKKAITVAAVGGSGLTVLTGASIGLVVAEAKLARRAIGLPGPNPPQADGLFGEHLATDPAVRPLRLAVLGDSTAAGYGVADATQTPGALLAGALVAHTGRAVLLVTAAQVGAGSDQLAEQVDKLLADPERLPQLAAVMIGANDITHRRPIPTAAAELGDAVTRLRIAGCQVVVGTCPDLGTIRPIQRGVRGRRALGADRRAARPGVRAAHRAVRPRPVPSVRGGVCHGGLGDAARAGGAGLAGVAARRGPEDRGPLKTEV